MPRKVKPGWGWDHTHDGADMARREANLDWDWLIVELGGDTPEKFTQIERGVLSALWPFYNAQFDDPSPSFDEMKAALGEISDT
uniref:hypothetical protein n=1 Tax=Candidatus Halocynthiibacter alkanivorans TaxID=2267619 RepID=UPI00109D09A7